jgi:glutathione S-transferase
MPYELFYWDGLQGRGEFIRLAFEESGTTYVDVARTPKGMKAMMAMLDDPSLAPPPFAPPFLRHDGVVISQVANILQYLGPKLGLAPKQESLQLAANGVQLTIADIVAEVHDTHHPLASGKYYEDQKEAALARSADFLTQRMPKFLGYFEKMLAQNPKGTSYSIGDTLTYVDLSLFQLVEGLRYAFPRATKKFPTSYPALCALTEAVRERPNVARYLASNRRIPFNESGIFRHYPELDRTAR